MYEKAFRLDLEPKAQMRGRAAARKGKNGKWHGTVYKDEKQEFREEILAACLMPHRPEKMIQGPVDMEIHAYLPVRQSWSAKKTAAALSGELRPHNITPDMDNMIKHLWDVMTALQFWKDDKQVCDLRITKRYAEVGWWDIKMVWEE